MARNRVYISCYSCEYSRIYASENNKKSVECQLNGRMTQLKQGVSHPEWCARKKGEKFMWIKLGDKGVQIKEENIDSITLVQEKRRGAGQRDWLIKTKENLTDYEQEILRFNDYDMASLALKKIVEALDERRSRLEL